MKKSLIALSAIAFAFTVGAAQAMKHEAAGKMDPVAAACKDKKAGDMVKVDGKDVKCPEAKKDAAPAAPAKK
jgi:Zn finger protein HypA/HybF involved in hydrogenase expression